MGCFTAQEGQLNLDISKNTKLKFTNCHNKITKMATNEVIVADNIPLTKKEVIMI